MTVWQILTALTPVECSALRLIDKGNGMLTPSLMITAFLMTVPPPTPDAILGATEKSLSSIAQVAFDAETDGQFTEDINSSILTIRNFSICSFCRDGDRYSVTMREFKINEEGNREPQPFFVGHALVANDRIAQWQESTAALPRPSPIKGVTSQKRESVMRRIMGYLQGGKVLDGYIGTDPIPWPARIRGARRLELAPQQEQIDSVSCIRLIAQAESGSYSMWVDPDVGYLPRRIELLKTGQDLLGEKTVDAARYTFNGRGESKMRQCRIVVSKVCFQKVGETWVPSEVTIDESQEYENGCFLRWHERQVRRNIKVGPKAVATTVFQLTVPDGASFSDQDGTNDFFIMKQGQLVRHTLVGGKLVPKP